MKPCICRSQSPKAAFSPGAEAGRWKGPTEPHPSMSHFVDENRDQEGQNPGPHSTPGAELVKYGPGFCPEALLGRK